MRVNGMLAATLVAVVCSACGGGGGGGQTPAQNANGLAVSHPALRVDAHIDLDTRLPQSTEVALYRMVQEGLTNAARHSGATLVSLVVARRNGSLQAIIEDDGSGFEVDAALRSGRSMGIHAIRERAELVGGQATFESSSRGTTVFIEVPI